MYNSSNTIGMVVNQILDKIEKNDEIVIVDDGSSDDSVKKIENFNDSRINLICSDRIGRSKALNVAVKNSKGKYLFINDADDFPSNIRFKESIKLLENGYDATFGQAILINNINESKINLINQEFGKIDFKNLEKLITLKKHSLFKTCNLHHSTLAIKREKLFEIGCYDEKLQVCVDLDLYFRFLVYNLKVCISNKIFIARNIGNTRTYASYPPKKFRKSALSVRKKYRVLLKPSIYTYIYDFRLYIKNLFFK